MKEKRLYRRKFPDAVVCMHDNCGKPIHFSGLCRIHWCRQRRYGDPGVLNTPLYGQVGKENKSTYRSWWSMKSRCLDSGHQAFKNYGGRGITICPEWMEWRNFLSSMGRRPDGAFLDRIDNDGNYEPGNCRWATKAESHKNRRWDVVKASLRAAWVKRKEKWGYSGGTTGPRGRKLTEHDASLH